MAGSGSVRINLESRLFVPVLFGLSMLATLGGAILVVWQASAGQSLAAGMIPLVIGAPLAFLTWQSLKGGADHLRIDLARGTIDHVSGDQVTSSPLDALGPLTITTYRRNSSRHNPEWHRLEAAGLPKIILKEWLDPVPVARLRDQLERAIAQSAVRRVLASAPIEDGAFRAAPDLVAQLGSSVRDPARLRDALRALARDRDRAISRRAVELHSALDAKPSP